MVAPPAPLQQVGRVSGLGATEEIKSVRFAGDVGYVVTFRLVDPLYVLDLSDPANPMEVGELKIPGFSRYLHPLSGGLLLGVGRDADPQTGWERGLQATLFDVSRPGQPDPARGAAAWATTPTVRSSTTIERSAIRTAVAWIPVGPNDHWLRQNHDGAFFGVRVTSEGLSHESTLRIHGEARRASRLGNESTCSAAKEITDLRPWELRRPGSPQLRPRVGQPLAARLAGVNTRNASKSPQGRGLPGAAIYSAAYPLHLRNSPCPHADRYSRPRPLDRVGWWNRDDGAGRLWG